MNNPFSPLPDLRFRIESGDTLDVRTFAIEERLGALFHIQLTAVSPSSDLDLEGFVGETARFDVGELRSWVGVVRTFEMVRAEPAGLSTYRIEMVPNLWLLANRRNHRVFQRMTEPDMAMQLLAEWKIGVVPRLDRGLYKKRDYRVQYAESDLAFVSRMLEDAGITYFFESVGDQSTVVLSDAPHTAEPRAPIDHVDDPSAVPPGDFATRVSIARELRPGKYTVRDVDFRVPPDYPLLSSSSAGAKAVEELLESFHYVPGAFLFEGQGDGTPTADDKQASRTSSAEGDMLARRRLDAKRSEARTVTFHTNALDIKPGTRVPIAGHPRGELGVDQPVLVTQTVIRGEANAAWSMSCRATRAEVPFRPPLSTPKPRVSGVETATVVGPKGEEIHTDEFGRVRVHFHWDRLSRMDDNSSCWVPVSQPWAGTGFGGVNIPRVGQEVVVDFVGGDPDRPLVVGRIYTASQPVPFKLPDNKTQSGWKSNSTTNTGGYNEIMLEDSAGKELVRIQAERDLNGLVKHDEEWSVLHDRTRQVKHNESITVENNRSHQVAGNERISIGKNQRVNVGINRSTEVGFVDSTVVGETHVVKISPPGAGGEAKSSSITMTDKKIVLDTGAGATIVMENDKITLDAEVIEIFARDYVEMKGKKKGLQLGAPNGGTTISSGKSFSLHAKKVDISGDKVSVSATGETSISGGVVQINGPGLFAGRVTDSAPDTILRGSSTVLIGGATFPFDVTMVDGKLHVGRGIVIDGNPEFQNKVLARLGLSSTRPAQLQNMQTLDASGHTMTIDEYHSDTDPDNSFCEPVDSAGNRGSVQAYQDATAAGQPVFDGGGNPILGPDGKQLMGTGRGTDTHLALNPDLELQNPLDPNHPAPNDAVLFHEMNHGVHETTGTYDGSPQPEDTHWDTNEERNTIQDGHPSEADYLRQSGYPYHRTSHRAEDWARN